MSSTGSPPGGSSLPGATLVWGHLAPGPGLTSPALPPTGPSPSTHGHNVSGAHSELLLNPSLCDSSRTNSGLPRHPRPSLCPRFTSLPSSPRCLLPPNPTPRLPSPLTLPHAQLLVPQPPRPCKTPNSRSTACSLPAPASPRWDPTALFRPPQREPSPCEFFSYSRNSLRFVQFLTLCMRLAYL